MASEGGHAQLARITHSALNPQDLLAAATAMKSKALLQRLGLPADLVGRPLPGNVRQALRDSIPKSYRSHFGRAERHDGDIGYVATWGMFANARCEDLLAEVSRIRQREPALMLTLNDLRKVAFRSARDIGNIEIDVILTHLLLIDNANHLGLIPPLPSSNALCPSQLNIVLDQAVVGRHC